MSQSVRDNRFILTCYKMKVGILVHLMTQICHVCSYSQNKSAFIKGELLQFVGSTFKDIIYRDFLPGAQAHNLLYRPVCYHFVVTSLSEQTLTSTSFPPGQQSGSSFSSRKNLQEWGSRESVNSFICFSWKQNNKTKSVCNNSFSPTSLQIRSAPRKQHLWNISSFCWDWSCHS